MIYWILAVFLIACFTGICIWNLLSLNKIRDNSYRVKYYYSRSDDSNMYRIGLFIGLPVLVLIIISVAVYFYGIRNNFSTEAIHTKVIRLTHQEQWTTKETRTETYTTGSGKNLRTHTRIYHVTKYHGPYFTAYTEDGNYHSINDSEYRAWVIRWNNEKQIGINIGSAAGSTTPISGKNIW